MIAVTDAEEGEVIRLQTQQCVVGQCGAEERHHQVWSLPRCPPPSANAPDSTEALAGGGGASKTSAFEDGLASAGGHLSHLSSSHPPPRAAAETAGMQHEADVHMTAPQTPPASAGGLVMESAEALRELCVLLHGMLQAHADDTGMADTMAALLVQLSSLRPSESEIQALFDSTFATYAPLRGEGAKAAAGAEGGTGSKGSGPAALGMARPSASSFQRGSGPGAAGADNKHALGCGLENMGNTCYMAAYMQVLVRAHKFTGALLKLPLPAAGGASAATLAGVTAVAAQQNDAEDRLVQQMQRLVATLLLSARRSVRAEGLLASLPSWFQGGHQQDTAEMARCLLASVDGRCDRLSKARPGADSHSALSAAVPAAALGDEEARQHSGRVQAQTPTKPTAVFQGKMQTRITCRGCRTVSSRSQVFYDLSLPVPALDSAAAAQSSAGVREGGGHGEAGGAPDSDAQARSGQTAGDGVGQTDRGEGAGLLTVDGLVRAVLQSEELTGDEQYACDKCGCKQDALRQVLVSRMPSFRACPHFSHAPTSFLACPHVSQVAVSRMPLLQPPLLAPVHACVHMCVGVYVVPRSECEGSSWLRHFKISGGLPYPPSPISRCFWHVSGFDMHVKPMHVKPTDMVHMHMHMSFYFNPRDGD